jgi:hypothetical protein
MSTTKYRQRITTQELDDLGWTWAVKLAEMDRKDYCRKQSQEQARYVSQLPKQQLGGLGTEHCFGAIGAGSGKVQWQHVSRRPKTQGSGPRDADVRLRKVASGNH